MRIEAAGEEIELLPERALFWPRERLLALSDVHLGKAEALQAHGTPIPAADRSEDLARLSGLVRRLGPRRVFVLGDWIHHRLSWTDGLERELGEFFLSHADVEWALVAGNHERGSLGRLARFPMRIVEGAARVGPFLFEHGHVSSAVGAEAEIDAADASRERAAPFVVQGHEHPAVVVREGPVRLRLPCFVLEERRLTLPSFGTLTGGHEVRGARGRRIYAVASNEVFETRVAEKRSPVGAARRAARGAGTARS